MDKAEVLRAELRETANALRIAAKHAHDSIDGGPFSTSLHDQADHAFATLRALEEPHRKEQAKAFT